jgi:hypothetical protein
MRIVIATGDKLTGGRFDIYQSSRLYPVGRLLQGSREYPEMAI